MNRVGISTACFYPMHTEEALDLIIKQKAEVCEVFLNTWSETEKEYLKRFRTCAEKGGVAIRAVHPFTSGFEHFMFFSEYQRRTEDAIAFYRRYFRAAYLLGADFVVLHGDQKSFPLPDFDAYCEVLCRLADAAREEGVTLTLENVSRSRSGCADFIRSIRKKIGKGGLKFTFDLKQACRAGENILDVADAMGSDLVHIHINDFAEGRCRLPFEGSQDIPALVRGVSSRGFAGDYIIEVYSGDCRSADDIGRAAQRLRTVIAENAQRA